MAETAETAFDTCASHVSFSIFHISEATAHGNVQGSKCPAVQECLAPEALHTLPNVLPAVPHSLALSQ